ncbi:flavin reductase family protein [Aquibacillus kalidii]|uniref:flavin reductase family protein n=1 Tax=Aquibacillus kalidii TaxID=2762597 RepID=UPI00164765D8|nr:flavin reductase family protein [Aquibacillus kalidii]
MENQMFREAMGKFATGITVITTQKDNQVYGMTVNAFMSISLEPKLIAISIDEKASMYNILQETNQFGISVLSEEQQDLSMIFGKQKDADHTMEYAFKNGVPLLEGSLVQLTCHVQTTVVAGDHIIFIAEVTSVESREGEPILYFGGKYRYIE